MKPRNPSRHACTRRASHGRGSSLTFGKTAMRIVYLTLAWFFAVPLIAQVESQLPQIESRVSTLDSRMSRLESRVRTASTAGAVAFLFGAFCALWAQNSGRSGWLWFFLGFLFSVITVLFLLAKNSSDVDRTGGAGKKPFDLQDFRQQ